MPVRKKILMLPGSTKATSVNKQILLYIRKQIDKEFEVEIYDRFDQLPYFNPDLEDELTPQSVMHFRDSIEHADGIIICTPEYVFNIPGILKNAMEWLVSTNLFTDKPTALITASSSGEKAHEYLNLLMKTIGADIGEHCSILIKGVKSKINSSGEITDIQTKELIQQLIGKFAEKLSG